MNRKVNKRSLLLLVVLTVTYMVSIPLLPVVADTTELQVTVSNTPQPARLELFTDLTYTTNATTLTPNDEMALNFTVSEGDQMLNLTYIKIVFWDSDKTTYDGAANDTTLCVFYWTESDASWNKTDDGSSSWAVNDAGSDDPGIGGTETFFEFSLAFTPGKVAYEETTDLWRVNVTAVDDDGLEGWNSTFATGQTFAGTAQWYGELSITTGATYGNFTGTSPGGSNVSIYNTNEGANDHLVLTVISNGVWDIEGSVTDWAGPESVDVDAIAIEWVNDDTSWDDGFTQSINTTPKTFWDGSTAGHDNTFEAGETRDAYYRLAFPSGKTGGSYTQDTTWTILNG